MEDTQRPFALQVAQRALWDTVGVFQERKFDIGLLVVAFILGIAERVRVVGFDMAAIDLWPVAYNTLAVFGLGVLAVLAFNFWLAPAALAYEQSRAALFRLESIKTPIAVPAKQIPWAAWKQRARYTLYEFAAILAKDDPADGGISNAASTYVSALKESIQDRKLRMAKPEFDLNGDIMGLTEIARPDALTWATERGFPTEHVE